MLKWLMPKRSSAAEVTEGAVFQRARANNIVETARVCALWSDEAGIPHVEFDLHIRQRDSGLHEHRTLSLDAFRALYGVRLTEKAAV